MCFYAISHAYLCVWLISLYMGKIVTVVLLFKLFFFQLKFGIFGRNQFVFSCSRVGVVEKYGLKQMQFKRKHQRKRKKNDKNADTWQYLNLRHKIGPTAQKCCPRIHNKNCLFLIESFRNKTMMNVPLISLTNTNMCTFSSNNCRKRIDNRNTRNNKRYHDGGKTCYTCYR